jgi:hypothetical protein
MSRPTIFPDVGVNVLYNELEAFGNSNQLPSKILAHLGEVLNMGASKGNIFPISDDNLQASCDALINVNPVLFSSGQKATIMRFKNLLFVRLRAKYDANNVIDSDYLVALIYILFMTISSESPTKEINKLKVAASISTVLCKLYKIDIQDQEIVLIDSSIDFDTSILNNMQFLDHVVKTYIDMYNSESHGANMLKSVAFKVIMSRSVFYGKSVDTGVDCTNDQYKNIVSTSALLSASALLLHKTKQSWDDLLSISGSTRILDAKQYDITDDHEKEIKVRNFLSWVVYAVHMYSYCMASHAENEQYIQLINDILKCINTEGNVHKLLKVIDKSIVTNGGSASSEWLSTKRRVTVKGSRKTVYRSRKTGELRVRSISINGRGTRTVRYVKFKSNLFSRS